METGCFGHLAAAAAGFQLVHAMVSQDLQEA